LCKVCLVDKQNDEKAGDLGLQRERERVGVFKVHPVCVVRLLHGTK